MCYNGITSLINLMFKKLFEKLLEKTRPTIGYQISIEYSCPGGDLTAKIQVSATDRQGTVDWEPHYIRWSEYFTMLEAELKTVGNGECEYLEAYTSEELNDLFFEAVFAVRREIEIDLDRQVNQNIGTFVNVPGQQQPNDADLLEVSKLFTPDQSLN